MITQDRLKQLLVYDAMTGLFVWRVRPNSKVNVGDVAGYLDPTGYIIIGCDTTIYRAHRLAWLYVHGSWPAHDIDHVNGVRHDNRLTNLRDVSKNANMLNRRTHNKNNVTKLRGVHQNNRTLRWRAQITINHRQIHLGYFDCADTAHAAYLEAHKTYMERAINEPRLSNRVVP